MMSPPPVQHLPSAPLPQLNASQLQLLAQLQQQQMTAQTSSSSSSSSSSLQSTASPALQSPQSPYSRPHPIQPKPISPPQLRHSLLSSPSSSSSTFPLLSHALALSPPSSTSTSTSSTTSATVELGTVLLSYLSSTDLQRGLLYVNRLWRFRALHILQSRHCNVHIQLHHLYLGPFRPSNMLELVFSTKVEVKGAGDRPALGGRQRTPEKAQPQLQQATVGYRGATLMGLSPRPSRPSPPLLAPLTPTSSVARATVCAPLPVSALVKAKEIAAGESIQPQAAVVGTPAGRPLSKKKMREAALLAESKYNSIVECGILLPSSSPPSPSAIHDPSLSRRRIFKQFSPFFSKQVEVYTAVNDPTSQVLYRASALADKFEYATNKVGMYLSRRRLVGGGIYQATGFRCKPPGRTGLKCGGYFLTIDACKEFENHFQYGGLTEEQRKEKGMMGSSSQVGGHHGAGEEAAEDSEGEEDGDKGMKMERNSAKGKPLSSVVSHIAHSPSFSPSPTSSSSKKRHLEAGSPLVDEGGGDSDNSPLHTSFKRVKSDDGSGSDSTGRSTSDGSDGGGAVSVVSVGKRSERSSGSDEEAGGQSPTQSTRSSKSSASAASVSSSSSHRSAFKAPSAYRQASFTHSSPSSLTSSSPPLALGSANDSISPPPSLPDLSNSPSTSPGTLGLTGYGSNGMGSGAPTMPAMYSSMPSPSTSSISSSASPSSSYSSMPFAPSYPPPAPLFSPPPVTYGQSAHGQSASPPLAVSHQMNALTLGQPPVVPLGYGGGGQAVGGLEAAFTSALMQQQRPQVAVGGGGDVSVGANGLLNINNLTLPQLQALLGVNGAGAHSLLTQLLLQQQHMHQHTQATQRYSAM